MVKVRLKVVEENDKIRNWQPPIDGADIMRIFNLPPSRNVGIIKTAVREAILDGIIPNNYEAAYGYMLEKARELGLQPVS
jgi:poly(A) polymerase